MALSSSLSRLKFALTIFSLPLLAPVFRRASFSFLTTLLLFLLLLVGVASHARVADAVSARTVYAVLAAGATEFR